MRVPVIPIRRPHIWAPPRGLAASSRGSQAPSKRALQRAGYSVRVFVGAVCALRLCVGPTSGMIRLQNAITASAFVQSEGHAVVGFVVALHTRRPIEGAVVEIEPRHIAVTDMKGRFEITGIPSGLHRLRISKARFLDKQSRIRVPDGPRTYNLVSSGLSLGLSELMSRGFSNHVLPTELWRWADAPRLRLQPWLLSYERATDSVERLLVLDTPVDLRKLQGVERILRNQLRVLTDGQFIEFKDVTLASSQPEQRVDISDAPCSITLAFFRQQQVDKDVRRYGYSGTGAGPRITRGYILLDDELTIESAYGQAVVVHELGHSLGYSHVSSTRSIMGDDRMFVFTPTQFDRLALEVIYNRVPGWQLSDIDPEPDRDETVSGAC
jgi:hypothetical protein